VNAARAAVVRKLVDFADRIMDRLDDQTGYGATGHQLAQVAINALALAAEHAEAEPKKPPTPVKATPIKATK
jgi:hypothetical protein